MDDMNHGWTINIIFRKETFSIRIYQRQVLALYCEAASVDLNVEIFHPLFPKDTKSGQIWGSFHEPVFYRNLNSMDISFCSHPSRSEVITVKFCTWHGSCASVAFT